MRAEGYWYIQLLRHGIKCFQSEKCASDAEVLRLYRHSLRPHEEIDRILCESGWGPGRFTKALRDYYSRYQPASQTSREIAERIRCFKTLYAERKNRLAHIARLNGSHL